MNSERGREIQGQAEHAREAGEFRKALELTDQATLQYVLDGDTQGLSEVQSSRLLTLRHLFEQTGKHEYLILAKHAALTGVELAEASGNSEALSMPYFNLAKAYEAIGDTSLAVDCYKKAIKYKQKFPGKFHNRVGVLADMIGHLSIAEYKAGDITALTRAEEALDQLQASNETQYNKDVWASGAHMRIAEITSKTDHETAVKHTLAAQAIIDANPELVLRKKQIAKLREKLSI